MQVSGKARREREHDKALTPVAIFAAWGLTHKTCACRILLFESQTRKPARNCLKLIVVWRAVYRERDERLERGKAGSEITDAGATLGWQRRQAQRAPCRVRIAFDEHPLWR